MTLNDLFSELQGQRFLAHFETDAVEAVEDLLTLRNGKTYIRCQIRDKEVQAKPEEIVRQLWIHRLLNRYKYPTSRMTVEYLRPVVPAYPACYREP